MDCGEGRKGTGKRKDQQRYWERSSGRNGLRGMDRDESESRVKEKGNMFRGAVSHSSWAELTANVLLKRAKELRGGFIIPSFEMNHVSCWP